MTPAQSRWVALALLVAVLLLLATMVAIPTWRLHRHYDEAIADATDRLERYGRVVAIRPSVEQAIATTVVGEARKYYLKATTATAAAAELQGLVNKIVESQNGHAISSQTIPVKEDGKATGPASIAVMIQMNAAIVPLQMIIHALETNEPYLFIDQVTVRSPQGRAYKPQPGTQPEYFVQLQVHGYLYPGEGKS